MNAEQLLSHKKQLLRYYEDELAFLRQRALEFSNRYKGRADALGLREGQATDPHVERLLEGVAFLAGRVRAKLDDEFPELTDSLLGILYPHLLAPVPSMGIVQFVPPPGAVDLVNGLTIPKHTAITSEPVDGVSCQYRTGYATTLWPLEITATTIRSRPFPANVGDLAPVGTKFLFTLKLRAVGAPSLHETALGLPPKGGSKATRPAAETAVRMFLSGDASATATFYEHLFNDVTRVVIRNPKGPVGSPPAIMDYDHATRVHEWVRPVGFDPSEALLPYPPQAFPGYRVLTEFFAYREKHLFADLLGWSRARDLEVLQGNELEVLFFLDKDVSPNLQKAFEDEAISIRLGCTPVVNLFERLAEVIPLTHRSHEYPIVPDRHHPDGYEVYSVQEVVHRNPSTGHEVRYEPFYAFRHRAHEVGRAYWYARRRASTRTIVRNGEPLPDRGTEVDLCFVDLGFTPSTPAEDNVLVKVMCVNRDLPTPSGEGSRSEVRFDTRGQFGSVHSVKAPTPTLRPPPRIGAFWRLISHLSLNHLSITDPEEGREALREYLRLYDYADPRVYPKLASVNKQVVDGLEGVSCGPDVELVAFGAASAYARGLAIHLSLDEEKFEGIGSFLFASVLDRFLAMYTSINSFTRTKYFTRKSGSEAAVKIWPPRIGSRPLL
jgi:type VI secretion system protein ImpG